MWVVTVFSTHCPGLTSTTFFEVCLRIMQTIPDFLFDLQVNECPAPLVLEQETYEQVPYSLFVIFRHSPFCFGDDFVFSQKHVGTRTVVVRRNGTLALIESAWVLDRTKVMQAITEKRIAIVQCYCPFPHSKSHFSIAMTRKNVVSITYDTSLAC